MQLNLRSYRLVQDSILNADQLGIQTFEKGGALIADFGIEAKGGLAAGIRLSEICLAGLGQVQVKADTKFAALPSVQVSTDHPLAACIGAQYAGWQFIHNKYFAMVSGPARCLRDEQEEIIVAAEIEEESSRAVAIFESREFPDESAIQKMAQECGVPTERLCICIAPTASFAGVIQIVARSIETTLHKLHELQFPLTQVVAGLGTAPLPIFGQDDFQALGWTNDAILYGASVKIWVDSEQELLDSIAPQLPSSASPDFGTPFLELFKSYDCDFYKMDKMLFSPAEVTLCNLRNSRTQTHGAIRPDLISQSMELG